MSEKFAISFRAPVLSQNDQLQLNPNIGRDYSGYPYPFGMDPVSMSIFECAIFLVTDR